jgi:hypothetical protein
MLRSNLTATVKGNTQKTFAKSEAVDYKKLLERKIRKQLEILKSIDPEKYPAKRIMENRVLRNLQMDWLDEKILRARKEARLQAKKDKQLKK